MAPPEHTPAWLTRAHWRDFRNRRPTEPTGRQPRRRHDLRTRIFEAVALFLALTVLNALAKAVLRDIGVPTTARWAAGLVLTSVMMGWLLIWWHRRSEEATAATAPEAGRHGDPRQPERPPGGQEPSGRQARDRADRH